MKAALDICAALLIVHCLFSRSVLHGGLGEEAGYAGQWWERRGASWRGMPWAAGRDSYINMYHEGRCLLRPSRLWCYGIACCVFCSGFCDSI